MQRQGGGACIRAGGELVDGPCAPVRGGGKGCGCGLPKLFGGYRPTAKDLQYLKKWKRGESIGFTMTASLKAKGLIPRTSKTKKGKKVVGPKYKTRRLPTH